MIQLVTLVCALLMISSACKAREYNDGNRNTGASVLAAPGAPSLEKGTGFAYGQESDPAYQRYRTRRATPTPVP